MTESLLPDDIVALARRVITENAKVGRRIVVAESCTGGLVTAALTEIAGSSAVLDRGFVTYSNQSKMEVLGVAHDIIDTFGAVSIACVWAMAQGALKRSNADVAVAVSGVAGPDGGTEHKPVGTVVFALVRRDQPVMPDGADPEAELHRYGPIGRSAVRRQAALCALEMLLP